MDDDSALVYPQDRSTFSLDREVLKRQQEDTLRRRRQLRTEVIELDEDEIRRRELSLPTGYYTAPPRSSGYSGGARSASRSRAHSIFSGSSGGSRQSQRLHQHWGSSLSLESENSGGELTSRRLRPPTPLDRQTPARDDPWRTTTPRRWLPSTGRTEAKTPTLKDYLRKPRLVNTVGCVTPKPQPSSTVSDLPPPAVTTTPRHTSHLAGSTTPSYRNLRLGGFLDHSNHADELIPEVLRQYYLDTFLDSYDSSYLTNFGDLSLADDGGGSTVDSAASSVFGSGEGSAKIPIHRSM